MKKNLPIIFLILLTPALFFPLTSRALPDFDPPDIPGLGDDDDLVPIQQPTYDEKEICSGKKIKVFGQEICTSKDAVLTKLAKIAIQVVLDSTINWINSGFEGNPAFVTDPEQYFKNLADGIAGEFIAGSDLAALCSPFQSNIRLSLQRSYTRAPVFQCTLSEVVDNIENFYDDFDQGGWDGWFAMTQNSNNNPYGAYLTAQAELDSRIAKTFGVQEKILDWGSGFLGTSECLEKDAETEECLKRGPITTPGVVVEGQLEKVLGSNVTQLELADEFDELTTALIAQLIKFVGSLFSEKGLNSRGGNVATPPDSSLLSCSPARETAVINEGVPWSVLSILGSESEITYSWSGSEILVSSGPNIVVTYATPGQKSASVTARTVNSSGDTRSVRVNCTGTVTVTTPGT